MVTKMVSRLRVFTGLAVFGAVSIAQCQVFLTGVNPTYSQNFDSLPSATSPSPWTNNSTLPGWYSFRSGANSANTTREATTIANTSLLVGAGTAATGGPYSFGPSGSTERALGSIASGNDAAGDFSYGVVLRNDTGLVIKSFTFRYAGEQWRYAGNAAAQSLSLDWRASATFTPADFDASITAGFSDEPTASFISPYTTGGTSASPLDGNSTGRTSGLGLTNVAVTMNPGDYLVIRWWDNNDSGNDHALAIDDFEFSAVTEAVPEPFTMALGAAGLAAAVIRRRRSGNR